MNEKIKIALVDDHRLVREGLSRLLSDIKEYEVVISVDSGKELLQQLDKTLDLVITDVSMPEMDGFALTPLLRKRFPTVKIIVLSMYNNHEYINKLYKLGVNGYLLKDSDINQIQKAINTVVVENEMFFTKEASKALHKNIMTKTAARPVGFMPKFSAKEIEVIQLLCEGLKAADVATKLNISPNTVNGHKDRIMNKMNVKNIVGVVTYAYKNNIVSL
jgi:two-component system response regulator DegU